MPSSCLRFIRWVRFRDVLEGKTPGTPATATARAATTSAAQPRRQQTTATKFSNISSNNKTNKNNSCTISDLNATNVPNVHVDFRRRSNKLCAVFRHTLCQPLLDSADCGAVQTLKRRLTNSHDVLRSGFSTDEGGEEACGRMFDTFPYEGCSFVLRCGGRTASMGALAQGKQALRFKSCCLGSVGQLRFPMLMSFAWCK